MSTLEQCTNPWEMHRELRETLVELTIAYLNAHPGRIEIPVQYRQDQSRIIGLRDSILYRFESLAYHIDLIRRREHECLGEFRNDFPRTDAIDVVRWASRDAKFLFDDLVFGIISLFDYYGNAIGFLLLDEPTLNKNWRGARAWAEGLQSGVRRTADLVRKFNDGWIRGVADYRNALIHAESDTAGGRYEYHLAGGSATVEILITAPAECINQIQYLRENLPANGLRLIDASLWLVGQTYDGAKELAVAIMADLNLPSPRAA